MLLVSRLQPTAPGQKLKGKYFITGLEEHETQQRSPIKNPRRPRRTPHEKTEIIRNY
jgi:hypothetical protein